jgi:hypothetical protein
MDELRAKHPDIKLHKLRALLREVTCYRCPDQSARYVQEELDELVEDEEAFEESTKPATDAEGRAVPQLYDSMVLFRESMRAMGELMKGMSELRKMIGDISEAATQPIQLGLQLVKENVELMRGRLQHYEDHHDRHLIAYEMLLSAQTERDIARDRAKGAGEVRKQAAGLAMAYLPQLLSDLKRSASSNPEAAAALDALASLEPEVLDSIVDAETHTPEQRAAWRRARDMLKQTKKTEANQQSQSQAA